MKWVKASERMPEKEGNYFIKVKGIEYQEDETVEYECGTYLHFVNTFQGKYSPALSKNETVVEWLDESSPSDNTQSIDKEKVAQIYYVLIEAADLLLRGYMSNNVDKDFDSDYAKWKLEFLALPDKETFINSLNLDNTQIRDGYSREDIENAIMFGFRQNDKNGAINLNEEAEFIRLLK